MTRRSFLHLGTRPGTRQRILVPLDSFTGGVAPHGLILGRTGVGKSSLIDLLCRAVIDGRVCGLLLIDGKGDLYASVEAYLARQHEGRRAILLDPGQPQYRFGLNFLELLGQTTAESWSEKVVESLSVIFDPASAGEYRPWWEEWASTSLVPLVQGKLTLLEWFAMLSISDGQFRNVVLAGLGDEAAFVRQKFRELAAFPARDRALFLNSVRTRASKFWSSPAMRGTFGQTRTSIDWPRCLDQGAVILARAHRTPEISEAFARLLGLVLIQQLTEVALQRPAGRRRPFLVVIDEFWKFTSPSIIEQLSLMRSFGVTFLLATQNLGQLKNAHWPNPDGLVESALGMCGNKIVFSVSRRDAEVLLGEVHAGEVRDDEIKHQIESTKFRPVESRRRVRTESHAKSRSAGRGETSGAMSGDALADASSFGFDDSYSFGVGANRGSRHYSSGASYGSASSSSSFFSSSSSDFACETEGETHGYSETETPFIEAHEFKEVTGVQFRSLEEQRERLLNRMILQPQRHCLLKLGTGFPMPMFTRDLERVEILRRTVEDFRERVLPKYARPAAEVDREVTTRVTKLLEEAEVAEEEAELRRQVEARDLEAAEGFREPLKPPPRRKRKDASL